MGERRDAPSNPMFCDEFLEVLRDLEMDLQVTILDLDREVGKRVEAMVFELIRMGGPGGPAEVVNLLMSGMLWMFMAGREHATRGYPAPVPRKGAGIHVPDTIAELFKADGPA